MGNAEWNWKRKQSNTELVLNTVRQPSGEGVFTPDVQTSRWIPYAGESNQVWYSMPHKQERIFVYFPSSDEEEAITMSSVRGTGGRMSDAPSMSKPTEKSMETKWEKTIGLHEDHIDFQPPLSQALFRKDRVEETADPRIYTESSKTGRLGCCASCMKAFCFIP